MVAAKKLRKPLPSQLLDRIHVATTTIVSLSRIAFGILVGEYGSDSFHDSTGNMVLRCNQFDRLLLAAYLILHRSQDFRVASGNRLEFGVRNNTHDFTSGYLINSQRLRTNLDDHPNKSPAASINLKA